MEVLGYLDSLHTSMSYVSAIKMLKQKGTKKERVVSAEKTVAAFISVRIYRCPSPKILLRQKQDWRTTCRARHLSGEGVVKTRRCGREEKKKTKKKKEKEREIEREIR